MAYACFPSNLPAPRAAPFIPAERVRRSQMPGALQSAGVERDFRGTQQVSFGPLTTPQAEALRSFWRNDLQRGGEWFVTNTWPVPQGWRAEVVRRFRGPPQWSHVARNRWTVTADTEVMGRSVVGPEFSPCSGGGGSGGGCGEGGVEWWIVSGPDPAGAPYVNEWELPSQGGTFDIDALSNFLTWTEGYFAGSGGSLFGFQRVLLKRVTTTRAAGGALVTVTPDTATFIVPPGQLQWLPFTGGAAPTFEPLGDGDGSTWQVSPSFETGAGVLLLSGGDATYTAITVSDGPYSSIGVEYRCSAPA